MGTARDDPRARVGARGRRSACGGDAMRWSMQGAWASAEVVGLSWAVGLALFTSSYFALYLCGLASRDAVAPALVLALAGVAVGARALRAARHHDQPADRQPAEDSGPR